jgi:NAD(P)-dependent dehydrogenase (short-subunit alcohol dehydrogenase family)
LIVKTDVSIEKDVENLFEEVQAAFGRPADVVLSNAGYLADSLLIGKSVASEWWKSFVSSISVPSALVFRFRSHLSDPTFLPASEAR